MGKGITGWIAGSVLVGIIVTLAIGAHARNSLWKNEIELWTDCVRKLPKKRGPTITWGMPIMRWDDGKTPKGNSKRHWP